MLCQLESIIILPRKDEECSEYNIFDKQYHDQLDEMQDMIEKERVLVEGAAGTSIAALIKMKDHLKNKRVGIIICGKNISLDVLQRIL